MAEPKIDAIVVARDELPDGDVKLTLPDGDWLVVATNPEHDRFNRFYKAWTAMMGQPGTAIDLVGETILALGRDWHMTGRDGHERPLDEAGLAGAPLKKLMALFVQLKDVAQALLGSIDPNA